MNDLAKAENADPLDVQIGGGHYKNFPLQPVEHLEQNGIAQCLPSICKYVMRYRDKDGARDLRKSLHFLDIWLALDKQGRAAPKDLIEKEVVLQACFIDALDSGQTRVLLAIQTDAYGDVWPEVARSALDHLLVSGYGAKAGD